jgi:hypothetical protein
MDYADWASQNEMERQRYGVEVQNFNLARGVAGDEAEMARANQALLLQREQNDLARDQAAMANRQRILGLATDLAPGGQAPAVAYAEGRAPFPEGGVQPWYRPQVTSPNSASNMRSRFFRDFQGASREVWRAEARIHNASVDANATMSESEKALARVPDDKVDSAQMIGIKQRGDEFGTNMEFKREESDWNRRMDLMNNGFRREEIELRRVEAELKRRGPAITFDEWNTLTRAQATRINDLMAERDKLSIDMRAFGSKVSKGQRDEMAIKIQQADTNIRQFIADGIKNGYIRRLKADVPGEVGRVVEVPYSARPGAAPTPSPRPTPAARPKKNTGGSSGRNTRTIMVDGKPVVIEGF